MAGKRLRPRLSEDLGNPSEFRAPPQARIWPFSSHALSRHAMPVSGTVTGGILST